jgi:hypothetical protein
MPSKTEFKKVIIQPEYVQHILFRTIALLVMGVFLVNGENVNASSNGNPRLALVSA